jgi:sulfoxide reductase heme-binding subunit YedZ
VTALWALSRATGLVSLVLLSLVVVLGVVVRRRRQVGRTPGWVLVDLHRNASLLAVTLIALHVTTVVADGYVSISWRDALLPFSGTYHPLWLGFGSLAVDLLLALLVTSLLRQHLSRRVWRAVHWLAYLAWPVAVVHGVGIGTDTRGLAGLTVVAACALAVAGAVLWRLSTSGELPAPDRASALMRELRTARSAR